MTSIDESGLSFDTLNDINAMICKKQSEIDSLIRVKKDIQNALNDDFILIANDHPASNGIGILMGSSQQFMGKIKILEVLPESIACFSGILKGDIIKKINGIPVSKSLSEVKLNICSSITNNITLTVQRGKKLVDIKIDKKKSVEDRCQLEERQQQQQQQ